MTAPMTPFASWILSVLVTLSPPDRAAAVPAYPGWAESAEARRARYESIAADFDAALDDEQVFRERTPHARRHSAAYVIAAAFHESGFAKDTDLGPCYRGPDGKGPRCDSGHAVSMFQIRADGDEATVYQHDRKAATLEAIRRIRRSLGSCRKLPPERRLAVYASGNCRGGFKESEEMYGIVARIMRLPPPVDEHPVEPVANLAPTWWPSLPGAASVSSVRRTLFLPELP